MFWDFVACGARRNSCQSRFPVPGDVMEYSIKINKRLYHSVPLLLRMFGSDFLQSPIRRPKGFPCWQLLLGVSGSGECILEGKRHILSPGEALLLPPDLPHTYQRAGEEDWIIHFLGFYGNSCQKLLADMQLNRAGIYHLKNQDACFQHIRIISHILESPMEDRNRLLSKELYSCLLDLARESSYMEISSEAADNRLVAEVLLYLEEHYAEDISLADLSAHTGKTPEYLCAAFRKETGDTIMRHLTEIRIGRARQLLLENPDLPVYVIGQRCGFRSPSYFGKVFRDYTGTTPQKLSRRHA